MLLTALLLPFLVSWVLAALLIRHAHRLGLVDLPDARKVHTTPTPRGGGLAFVAGMLATAAVLPFVADVPPRGFGSALNPLWLTALGVAALGLADDLRPLPWQLRLLVQLAAAGVAVWLVFPRAGWLIPLAALWVAAMANAFNMLDNMDALSGGTAFVAALALAGTAWLRGLADAELPWLALAAALLGFLWFNRPRARLFMGDVGSTFLGFVLGVGSLQAAFGSGAPAWGWLVPLCLLAVPCYDMATVVTLRLSQGRSPFHADKQHVSHRLVAKGLRPAVAVGVIHLLAVASGAAGLLLYAVPSETAAGLVVAGLALLWGAFAVIDFRPRATAPAEQTEPPDTKNE